MRHLTDGEIRTYLDGESSSSAHVFSRKSSGSLLIVSRAPGNSFYDCQHGGQTVICLDTIANGSAGFLSEALVPGLRHYRQKRRV